MGFKELLPTVGKALWETLYMTVGSTLMAYILGLPLGVLLAVTADDGLLPNRPVNRVLGTVVNLLRSVPFIILLVWVMPLTRAIVGTTIGSTATLVPLVIASAPFLARMVESSLREVDRGVIEAAQAMGASPMQIITRVMLVEAKPSLITGAAIALATILGYSAMSGIVGGGGLGTIAINYGYYRGNSEVMLLMVALLVLIVEIFQDAGSRVAMMCDRRLRNGKNKTRSRKKA